MKNGFRTILLAVVIAYHPISLWATPHHKSHHEKNYFQFAIAKYHTTRQSGQTVDIYVKYAYKPGLPTHQYPDYRLLRTHILKYMKPSDDLPRDIYWEIIATNMGRDLMQHFPLDGVSIQLNVLDNQAKNHDEPGDHGPTFTIGNVAPLDIH